MKLLFDFLPIIAFFIIYKIFNHNIYIATGSILFISILQAGGYWLKNRKINSLLLTNCILIIILGGATLWLHESIYVKWKVTVIYWLYGAALLISQFLFKKPLVKKVLESNLTLPEKIWYRINLICAVYFTLLGTLNLYVVYHFSTNAWVNFKLFGVLGLTIVFFIGLSVYLAKYMQPDPENPSS